MNFQAHVLILSLKDKPAEDTTLDAVINDRNTIRPGIFVGEAKDCLDAVGGIAVMWVSGLKI